MPSLERKVYIIGVGSTAYIKPRGLVDYPEMAVEAATKALLDAGINYDDVQAAMVGYVNGSSTCGQRSLYALGMTQIPIMNVNNNCATGSSALWLAKNFISGGQSDCTMALGFEKMAAGPLTSGASDQTSPLDLTMNQVVNLWPSSTGPFAAQIFGNGGAEYLEKYGGKWEDVAQIASKNHNHSVKNPYSQFRNPMTVEEVMKDKMVTNHMPRAMCCPTSDGSSCAILASESFVRSHGLENQAIEIAAMATTTDSPRLYEDRSAMELTGLDMTRKCAAQVYKEVGIGPQDLKVIELHDCFAANELLVYEGLGLYPPGKAHEIGRNGDNTYGGKWVVNPSGGLESKGHPLGATGLGMIFYLSNQLRGWAGPMQVDSCHPANEKKSGGQTPYAMQHNLGLGGACVMSILKRPEFWKGGGKDGRDRLGYNHGCEYRKISQADIDKVKSRKYFSQFATGSDDALAKL